MSVRPGVAVTFLVLAAAILVAGIDSRAQTTTTTTTTVIIKNPTIGSVLWWQVGNAVQQGAAFANLKAGFSNDIAKARDAYFACYPGCSNIKNLESQFSAMLWQKDLYYMYLKYVGSSAAFAADQLTGDIDGGITPNCLDQFNSWEASMEIDSGHFTQVMGMTATYDAQKFLRALDLAKDDYKTYQTCRDGEEFRLHARPPYNNVPAPQHYVETDPNKISVHIAAKLQLIHVTLLDPIAVPPKGMGANEGKFVRARLDAPLMGVGAQAGYTGNCVFLAPGAQLVLHVFIGSASPDGKKSRIQVMLDPSRQDKSLPLMTSSITHHDFDGWPAEGAVLLPAQSKMSFILDGGTGYMSKAAFEASVASVAAAKNVPEKYSSLPILMGSTMPFTLLDQIDTSNLGTGKLYHGKMTSEMTLPQGMPDIGALKLPAGTDVYLKATDRAWQYGHIADVSIDHVVYDGRNVPLTVIPWHINFTPPGSGVTIRRQVGALQPVILRQAGFVSGFTVAEQEDVPESGPVPSLAGTVGRTPAAPSAAPAAPAPAPAAPAPKPAVAAQPSSNATARSQSVANRQQLVEDYQACTRQAVQDHPSRDADYRTAMADCAKEMRTEMVKLRGR